MYRPLVRQALGVGLLVALVLTLSACGGGEEQAKPRPLPEDRKALPPGEYRSEEFIPSFSFKVGQGWSTSPPEVFDALLLTRGETVGLGFVNPQQVYKPTRSGSPEVVEAPDDLVGWFQQHPYLKTSKLKTVTVGGIEGIQFEVVVENLPADYSGVCAGDCVDIFRSQGFGWIAFREDSKSRVIVLEDVNGETITMGFTIPASQFDKLAPEAQEVIDTVEWKAS